MGKWTNIVVATFAGERRTRTRQLHQWDYGQVLQFADLDLPGTFQVRFSNQERLGTAKTQIGADNAVEIPDEYLATGQYVYAFVFLHTGDADGETVFVVEVPVIPEPTPVDEPPTPQQESVVDQAIAALNDGVTRTEAAAQEAEADALKSEGYAVGTQDGEPVGPSSPYHENNAAYYADMAEQAAGQAGYMFFYIDENGDLIYQRTPNVQVDFYLEDGDLYVKEAD